MHREPVSIVALISTRTQPLAEAVVVNLSEGGVRLGSNPEDSNLESSLGAGEEIRLRFALPPALVGRSMFRGPWCGRWRRGAASTSDTSPRPSAQRYSKG